MRKNLAAIALAEDRAEDPEVRRLAEDIAGAQAPEIAEMQRLLGV